MGPREYTYKDAYIPTTQTTSSVNPACLGGKVAAKMSPFDMIFSGVVLTSTVEPFVLLYDMPLEDLTD